MYNREKIQTWTQLGKKFLKNHRKWTVKSKRFTVGGLKWKIKKDGPKWTVEANDRPNQLKAIHYRSIIQLKDRPFFISWNKKVKNFNKERISSLPYFSVWDFTTCFSFFDRYFMTILIWLAMLVFTMRVHISGQKGTV